MIRFRRASLYSLVALAGGLTAAPAPARSAPPLELLYSVQAAGTEILRIEAVVEVTPEGYRLQTSLRTQGIAALLVKGEQRTRAEGRWRGTEPAPIRYRTEGMWRGKPRRVVLDFVGTEPRLVLLEPTEEGERDEVPAHQRRGTLDGLSALAKMSRIAERTGRCDGAAATFDGRRRMEWSARSLGEDLIPGTEGAWGGQALRCAFEGRLTAGFRRDQDAEHQARPHKGLVWLATLRPDLPPLPVRIEMPSRWFGSVQGVLLRVGPPSVREVSQ